MTLAIYDKENKKVSFPQTIDSEVNGTSGEETLHELYLINDSQYTYREVRMSFAPKAPVNITVSAEKEGSYSRELYIPEIRPSGKATFYLKVKVPEGTKTSEIDGSIIQLNAREYP
jgi:hypothetical protein